MNERPVRKTTTRTKNARKMEQTPRTGTENNGSSSSGNLREAESDPEIVTGERYLQGEPDQVRSTEPAPSPNLPPPDNGSMEGIHPPDANRAPEQLPLLAGNGNPDPITDSQTLEVVRLLAEKLAAQERALANVIAELQARNGIASNGGTQPRGTLDRILELGANITNAIAQGVARSQPTAESTLTSRLLDMTLNHYAVIDQVYLKTAGLPALPVKPNHVVMTS